MDKKLTAEQLDKIVSILKSLNDKDFNRAIKITKKFRKAEKSLERAKTQIAIDKEMGINTMKGVKYEYC